MVVRATAAGAPGPARAHQAARRLVRRRQREPARRRRRFDALVGQREQQPDDEGVREQRRAAVADERQRHAGQRQHLEVARRDDERLDPDDQRQPDREQRPEVVGRGGADPQAALDDDEVEAEDRDDADDAELLAERREREVRVDLGDRRPAADLGQARPEPDAEQPAARERVERLDDLVAGAERVGERVEPDVDPGPDVVEQHRPSARCRAGTGPAR